MLSSLPGVQVYLAIGFTDMRKAINGLSILVEEKMDLDPFSGHLFGFCNRKRDIVKILYWDRNGFCLWQKRLEKDRFRWPSSKEDVLAIESRELTWLLGGLSITEDTTHRRLVYSTVV